MANTAAEEGVPTPPKTSHGPPLRWRLRNWLKTRLWGPAPIEPTSLEELLRRLKGAPAPVVDHVYELAKRLVDDERGRQARLDAKANSLLAVVGLSLTVAFTFGGTLVKDAASFPVGGPRMLAAVAFGGALICGLIAAFFAVSALWILGNVPGMDESSVFNEKLFTHLKDGVKPEEQATQYKVSLTVHLWRLGSRNRGIQERKAKIINKGQFAFAAFLGFLLVVFGSLVYAASITDVRPQAAPVSSAGPAPSH